MSLQPRYRHVATESLHKPNGWDLVALLIIAGIIAALVWGASHMATPYHVGKPILISLDPSALPGYALRTVLRMFIAIGFSLLFTFIAAPLAAKNAQAEKLIIPFIDIAEAIPPLGVLAIVIVAFIQWFPDSLLGPECAAIFVIFTAQAWNMALSFYQSLRTLPLEFQEAATLFQLSGWQRFWRIEVPYAMPALLWNTMMSMSAGWFFLVASEAISVANQHILLPGIGSYIHQAIVNADLHAIFYAIAAMLVVILLYDQLLFRPLLVWSNKFKLHSSDDDDQENTSWFYDILLKTRSLRIFRRFFESFKEWAVNQPSVYVMRLKQLSQQSRRRSMRRFSFTFKPLLLQGCVWAWNVALILGIVSALYALIRFIHLYVSLAEIRHVFFLGSITAGKIALLIVLTSLLWIPIGVWIGLNPRLRSIFQPLVQFLAAFPINLIYPLVVTGILYYQLNVDIWSTPLMILGTQWYLVFNIIAGAAAIPPETLLAAKNFGVKGFLWWRRLVLPAIFPYYITGAMTTAGGCWNASIVADVLKWGDQTLIATGLGSYITQYTEGGDFPRTALGLSVMCIYVLIINRLVWHQLYQLAASRFSME
jgi:NitT/TauT family transport system permease protein